MQYLKFINITIKSGQNKSIYKIIFVLLFFLSIHTFSSAQCDNNLRREAYKAIEGGTYIRDFKISLAESKPKKPTTDEKSIMLNKGNRYRFVIMKDPTRQGNPIVRIYDQHTDYATNLVATGSTTQIFDFVCNKTQVYNISIHFENGKDGCCILMMGLMN